MRKKSSRAPKRFRDILQRWSCQQLWLTKYGEDSRKDSTVQKHVRIRHYLNISQEVVLDYKSISLNYGNNSDSITKRYQGDQDWIRVCITQNFNFWPDEWIQSYKWEMRSKPRFDSKPRGQRDFAINGDPTIKDDTSIAVFHGDPNPHNCKDQWVIDNWK